MNYGIDVTYTDYPISGKMITATTTISEADFETIGELTKDVVRRRLVTELVNEILENKMCEVTTHVDPTTLKRKINARVFVAPDSEVRLLRKITNVR